MTSRSNRSRKRQRRAVSAKRNDQSPKLIPSVTIPDDILEYDAPDDFTGYDDANLFVSTDTDDTRSDVFISHASEDKDAIVRPLVQQLQQLGLSVWYDEFSLSIGDSLSRSIDKGLAACRFGLVIISKAFMAKAWPEYELRGLVAREVGIGKVILPIWHQVTRDEVLQFSPPLADKVALNTGVMSVEQIAIRVLFAISPERYQRLEREVLYKKWRNERPLEWRQIDELLTETPIIHETLPDGFLRRIRLIHEALRPVFLLPWKQAVDNFRKDHHPQRELAIWERIASTFLAVSSRFELTHDERKRLFGQLLGWSLVRSPKAEFDSHLRPDWLTAAHLDFHQSLPMDREPL